MPNATPSIPIAPGRLKSAEDEERDVYDQRKKARIEESTPFLTRTMV
jgi:hypothetical protein